MVCKNSTKKEYKLYLTLSLFQCEWPLIPSIYSKNVVFDTFLFWCEQRRYLQLFFTPLTIDTNINQFSLSYHFKNTIQL